MEQVKRKPVRKPLPEDLPRVEEHLYPAEISDNKDAWTELEPEITEVLEYEPGRCYVRKIVRHKYVPKKQVITGDETIVLLVTGMGQEKSHLRVYILFRTRRRHNVSIVTSAAFAAP